MKPTVAYPFDPAAIEVMLPAAAAAGSTLSYSEALEGLGMKFSRPKMRALCKALAAVDARAEAKGQPELAVLVVRASDGLPGAGWWSDAARHAGLSEDANGAAFVHSLQEKAFAYWRKKKRR
jgi:hypothetical protein